MRTWSGKKYWLVGASEGLGRALAQRMSAAGTELFLSARTAEALQSLADELPGKAHVVTVDVADSASVREAAEKVGEIDGIVFLAGVYWPTPAQDWNADEVERMCNINFTGGARAVGAVIGQMVARDDGHIVLTGSLSGFRGLPGAIGYSASKAGLMALAESMYADLRGSGVQVQIVNPGFIRTRLTDKNDFSMPFIMEPEEAARIMFEHMNTDHFKRSFPTLFSLLFRFSQFWPDWLYYRVFRGKA